MEKCRLCDRDLVQSIRMNEPIVCSRCIESLKEKLRE